MFIENWGFFTGQNLVPTQRLKLFPNFDDWTQQSPQDLEPFGQRKNSKNIYGNNLIIYGICKNILDSYNPIYVETYRIL